MIRIPLLLLILLAAVPAQAAERILALSPHACEMLYAIGAGDEIIGRVDYCDYPRAARALPGVGNYQRINAEAALRLHPTMAVVLDANVPGVAQLARMGVRIIASHPATIDEVLVDMQRLAQLTGHAARGQQVVAGLRRRLDAVAEQVADAPRYTVFYELWHQPLLTAGHDSFIADVLRRAGLHNVFDGVRAESPRISIEAVLRARPQLVIVPEEGRNLSARRQFWHHWLGTSVRVIGVPPDLLHRPGPRIVDGLELLVRKVQAGG